MRSSSAHLLFCMLLAFHRAFQTGFARQADLELDLDKGQIKGKNPYLTPLDTPQTSRKVPCSSQAVIRLDFSGPYKRAKFELFYGQEPKLWTFLISDSPAAYGFGGNHKYTSNCASVQLFNKQLRIYSNVLPDYRYHSMDGHTLMDVEDDVVGKGSNVTIEVGDQVIAWKTKRRRGSSSFMSSTNRINPDRDRLRSPFLFTLAGQKTEFGPNECYLYAAFNRVPLGRFHNGSGLCHVRITLKRKNDNGVCAKFKHLCHRDAVCKQTSKSFKCVCRPGYVGDGKRSCKDFNECAINKGGCKQVCHNTPGSYCCSCSNGYTLLPNGRSCSGKRRGSSLISKRIKLRFNVGECNIGRKKQRIFFFNELKRKLLRQEICRYPCEIHGSSLKCRLRSKDGKLEKLLLAHFELELDQETISTSRYCNDSCLRCQVEKKLWRFIVDLRSLAHSERFNVSLRGQVYTMNDKSVRVQRVRNSCNQGRRRKNKRVAGCMPGMYFDIFLQRCVNCSRGTYQPNRSETFCFRCPNNMTTTYSGSRELDECLRTRCGGNLTAMSGIITSPNYPDAYPRDLDCTWTIFPSQGRNLLLLIPNISLPTSSDCSDYLTMREGKSPHSVATYYACESFDQPVAFVSRSKNLYIKFRSRSNVMAEGFKIFYVTFEKGYRALVRHIVESGEMYTNESNRRLLQDETLVRQILDVIVDPPRLYEMYPNVDQVDNKVPKSFRIFIERKVKEFFTYSPFRRRRSLEKTMA